MKAKNGSEASLDRLLDSFIQELIALPDDQALEGVDRDQVKARAVSRLQTAKQAAGKVRMARASARSHISNPAISESVSASAARDFLRQIANDPRYTLAARSYAELSDQEVLDIYWQLKSLEHHKSE